jgi:hypothetical protein
VPEPDSPLDAALTTAAADLIDQLEQELSRAGHDWNRMADLSRQLARLCTERTLPPAAAEHEAGGGVY